MRISTTLALGLTLALASCSSEAAPTQRNLMQQTVDLMNQFAAQLEKVTDEASAKAAAKAIDPIVEKLRSVVTAGEQLGEPTEELAKEFEPKFKAVTDRIGAIAIKSMSDPKLGALLQPLLEKLQGMPGATDK